MKQLNKSKNMKTNLFTFLLVLFSLVIGSNVYGQAVGDYGSTGNMNWSGGTWNVCTSVGTWTGATTTTTAPTTQNVWILAGHTVTMTANASCANLNLYGNLADGGYIITVSKNIGGSSSGTHYGNGRLVMTQNVNPTTIASGVTLGSLYINAASPNTVKPQGNITISNDLVIKQGAIDNNGYTIAVGGNIFNMTGANITLWGTVGKYSMTGTSTVSGVTSAYRGGSGWTAGAITFTAPASGVTATGTITAAGVITITDPGSGYTTAPTGFTGGGSGSGGTFTCTIGNTNMAKYMTCGGGTTSLSFVMYNLELANTVANNQVILSSGTDNYFSLYVNTLLSFTSGNTSGKLILNTSLDVTKQTQLSIGNNSTGSISMSSTNAIGTAASGYGKLYLNTTSTAANAGGTLYFDQTTPGTTNNFRDVQAYRPNNTIGNNLIISNSFTFSGGTASTSFYKLIVGAGANLTVPSFSITLPSGSPYTLDASASSATLTVTGNGATIAPSTLTLTSSTIGNLVVAGSNTLATGQNLTVSNNLTLTSGTVNNSTNNITLGNGATIVRTAGALSTVPTFGSSVNLTYNGGSSQSSSYELPTSTTVLNNLTTNSSGVTLNASATVNGLLTLNGKLTTATSTNLTLGSSATLSGASTSNYIDLSNGGNLIRKAVSSSTTLFPIGAVNYTPITLTNATNTPDITATVGTTFSGAPKDATKCVTLQWSLLGSVSSTSDITYQFNGANGGSAFSTSSACDLGTYSPSSSTWTVASYGTPSGSNPYTLSTTGVAIATTANKYVIGNNGQVMPSSEVISTWSGNVDTDWTKSGNWSAEGVPSSTISAVIPSGRTNYPVISTTQQVNNLTIQSGASITNNGTLQVIGQTLSLNGAISGTGTTEFAAIATQTITGSTATFSNIKINNVAGVVNNGTLTINGSVTVNTGVLSGTAPVYATNTPVTYTGSITTGAGLILNPSSGNVGLLTINGSGTFTLSANTSVTGVALTSGTLADGGFTLTSSGNVSATSGIVSGTGKVKLTGAGATVSGSTFVGLEIAAGGGNTITANNSMTISNLILTSGTLNDNGYVLTVSGNVDGTSGIHAGNGRLKMTGTNPTIATGVTLGSLYVNLASGTVTPSGDLTISNDLILKTGTITDNGKVISIGGNIYNLEGAFVTLNNSTGGKFSMTGTSTISGLTSAANPSGSSWTAGTITFDAPVSGIAAVGTITTAGVISITEPGSGYTTSPTNFTGSNSGTATTTIGTTTTKYITCGGGTTSLGMNMINLELANTQVNNKVILSSGTDNWFAFYVNGTLSFASGNTTGKLILNTSLDILKQTQLSIGNNTAGNIVMASTNAIGTAAAGYGKLYLNTTATGTNAGGTLYFDQTTQGTTNYFSDMQCFRSNNTIGNDVRINYPIYFGGGTGTTQYTLTVAPGVNLTSAAFANSYTNGVYSVDASNATATLTFTGNNSTVGTISSQTNVAGIIYPTTIGNLNIAGSNTLTLGQALTVSGNLTLTSGTLAYSTNTFTLSNGTTIIRKAGALNAAPTTFGTTTNITYNNTSAITTGNEVPASGLNNLTIDNTAAVGTGGNITVNGILNITAGSVLTNNNTVYTNGNVTVNGTFKGNGMASGSSPWYVQGTGSPESPVTISLGTNGIIGASSVGTSGESLSIFLNQNGNAKITSSGTQNNTINIARFTTSNGSNYAQATEVDANVNVNNTNSSTGVYSFALQLGNDGTVSKSLTVNAGKTLTLTNAYTTWGYPLIDGTFPNYTGGAFTYNIYGTLDASISTTNLLDNKLTSTNSNAVHVYNGGVLKLGAANFGTYLSGQTGGVSADAGSTVYLNGTVTSTSSNTGTTQDAITGSGDVIVNSTSTLAGNATAKSLTLNAALSVNAGKKLTVSTTMANNSTLNLLSDATGTATITTPATISGSGTANVSQYLGGARNWYISSPVSGATVPASGYTFYQRNEALNSWPIMSSSDALNVGQGYIALPSSGPVTYTFTGTLNTGDVTVNLQRTTNQPTKPGFNLIGNPYPSYLNVRSVINAKANLQQTIWYRTRTTGDAPTYNFETVNLASGVGTSNAGEQVTALIPPMQSFWVRTNANGETLTFTNSLRSHAGVATTDLGDVSTTTLKVHAMNASSSSVLRLQVSNGKNTDQTVLYTSANASNGYDDYDSQKFFNSSASIAEICTIVNGESLAINGMNSIPNDTEIVLGFSTLTAGTFSIRASQIADFDPTVSIYLKDNVTNSLVQLTTDDSYSFTSDVTTNNTSRFALVFKSASIATGINPNTNENVWISTNANNQIMINGSNGTGSVAVYNAVGQKMYSNNLTSNVNVLNTPLHSGAYLVTVTTSGKSITKKVIID